MPENAPSVVRSSKYGPFLSIDAPSVVHFHLIGKRSLNHQAFDLRFYRSVEVDCRIDDGETTTLGAVSDKSQPFFSERTTLGAVSGIGAQTPDPRAASRSSCRR